MKEKLLAQLKIARGNTANPTDRTLEQLAATLSAGITEETQIPAIVETWKPLLPTIAGEVNHFVAEAVKKQSPPVPPADPTPPTEPAWFTEWKQKQAEEAEALKTKYTEIESKLAGQQKKEKMDAIVSKAKDEFYKKWKISDVEKPLFEKAVSIELTLNPTHETHETLITGIKTQFEELRSTMGLGKIEPVDNGGGGGNKKPQQLLDLKAQMQKQGKLPKPEAAPS